MTDARRDFVSRIPSEMSLYDPCQNRMNDGMLSKVQTTSIITSAFSYLKYMLMPIPNSSAISLVV